MVGVVTNRGLNMRYLLAPCQCKRWYCPILAVVPLVPWKHKMRPFLLQIWIYLGPITKDERGIYRSHVDSNLEPKNVLSSVFEVLVVPPLVLGGTTAQSGDTTAWHPTIGRYHCPVWCYHCLTVSRRLCLGGPTTQTVPPNIISKIVPLWFSWILYFDDETNW